MQIAVPKEDHPWESRVPLLPDHVEKLTAAGAKVAVESGTGVSIHIPDDRYRDAGADIVENHDELMGSADLIIKLRKPSVEEIALMTPGAIYVGLLDPFNNREIMERFAERGVSAVSMEMIPRATRLQKMDVLSSQASLAGYAAVIIGAERMQKILPMMMTPSGTISPARVFVIGAGVAGLQAIATAKRLGARVEAFDTRPVVAEQVQSLGAKFVQIDLGETGQTEDGYAKQLTDEQIEMQREGMARICARSDLIITTAQLFGRPAPRIVTRRMIEGMAPGSVIVDLAVESGGNVEGAEAGREVDVNGVTVVGQPNLPGRAALDASRMLSANFHYFIAEFWDDETQTFAPDPDNDLIKGCLITHDGRIVNDRLKEHYA